MPPLRILHIAPYSTEAWAYGGIPRALDGVTRGLRALGHEVTVAATDVCDARSRLSQAPANTYLFKNVSNSIAYRLQLYTPLSFDKFLKQHATQFDVAHIHGHHHLLGVIASRRLTDAKIPYVVTPHGTALPIERRIWLKRIFHRSLAHNVLPRARKVLAVSNAEREQLLGMGLAPHHVEVISNPIDVPAPTKSPAPEPTILFLGKITPRKNLDTLVRAFATLANQSPIKLIIAGSDMGGWSKAERTARDLNVLHRIERRNLLLEPERSRALAQASVVAYAGEDEVFGLVAFEALSVGTPVVVANDSGCGEWVKKLGGGITVPPRDADALAFALNTVITKNEIFREQARRAGEAARTNFSATNVAQQLTQVYRQVLA
jgi:glycosyltransferase involved in cell wall biosynthesis